MTWLAPRTGFLGQLVAAISGNRGRRSPEPPPVQRYHGTEPLKAALAAGCTHHPVNATVRLRSADTTYGSCHTLPTTLDYGN